MRRTVLLLTAFTLAAASPPVAAEDWPEWRGAGRLGVWTESGILDEFPAGGLTATWRVPVGGATRGRP